MEQLIEDLTRGNVSQVKVVVASVAAALAAVGYGKLRTPLLAPRAAFFTHRASGDAIVVLVVLVGLACIGYYGFDEEAVHYIAGTALFAVLALKIAIIRWWHGLGRLLPVLGITVFLLLAVTWLTSAGGYLTDD
jgi:hypothetical protein